MLAIGLGEIAAIAPLGAVLGFAALLLKRWWTQQDNAMAAAIEASTKEGARCEERIAQIRARHERDMGELRDDYERMQTAIRQLLPLVPPDVQAQLWDLMWSQQRSNSEPANALARGPTPTT